MSTENIVFLSIVAALVILFIVDKLTNHAILKTILQWRPALAALTALAKAVSAVLPSSNFAIAVTVLDVASRATQKAEELYKLSELPKEERNTYAKQMISATLTEAGIEVTEQVQQIIDGCIAIICMLMPHNVVPDAAAETVDGKLVDATC
jgi:hypothetical protein